LVATTYPFPHGSFVFCPVLPRIVGRLGWFGRFSWFTVCAGLTPLRLPTVPSHTLRFCHCTTLRIPVAHTHTWLPHHTLGLWIYTFPLPTHPIYVVPRLFLFYAFTTFIRLLVCSRLVRLFCWTLDAFPHTRVGAPLGWFTPPFTRHPTHTHGFTVLRALVGLFLRCHTHGLRSLDIYVYRVWFGLCGYGLHAYPAPPPTSPRFNRGLVRYAGYGWLLAYITLLHTPPLPTATPHTALVIYRAPPPHTTHTPARSAVSAVGFTVSFGLPTVTWVAD